MANIPIGTKGEFQRARHLGSGHQFPGTWRARACSPRRNMIRFMEMDLPQRGAAAAGPRLRHGGHARQCRASGRSAHRDDRHVYGGGHPRGRIAAWSSAWKRATRRRRSAKARTSAPSSTSRNSPRAWRKRRGSSAEMSVPSLHAQRVHRIHPRRAPRGDVARGRRHHGQQHRRRHERHRIVRLEPEQQLGGRLARP